MIRRILYFLLVTVLLGGLAGAIAFYAFDFKPKMLATVILGAPQPPETVSAEPARTDSWQPQIAGIGTAKDVFVRSKIEPTGNEKPAHQN